MKLFKKITAAVLVTTMALGLAACDHRNHDKGRNNDCGNDCRRNHCRGNNSRSRGARFPGSLGIRR